MQGFRAQRIMKAPRGFSLRTKRIGSHCLVFAVPPGRRRKGAARLVEVLHPQRENPSRCHAQKNPAELLIFGNPRRSMRRNSEAEDLYADFHGVGARKTVALEVPQDVPLHTVALGDLEAIGFGNRDASGREYHGDELVDNWQKCSHLSFAGDDVKLASDAQGRQLYLIGGDQRLQPSALSEFGASSSAGRMKLMPATFIVYNTRKKYDGFAFSGYVHEFGEDGGRRPTIYYDQANKQILIRGGSYRIEPQGIIN